MISYTISCRSGHDKKNHDFLHGCRGPCWSQGLGNATTGSLDRGGREKKREREKKKVFLNGNSLFLDSIAVLFRHNSSKKESKLLEWISVDTSLKLRKKESSERLFPTPNAGTTS